ncbi:MFS transporter [Alphaproteobacteria bacterium]|nr:MFS transporter [Alphaproteobacteria bacterium]
MGLLITQFSIDLGWTAATVSVGVALNMLLYGVTAPFALILMHRYGIKPVSIAAMLLLLMGSGICLWPSAVGFNFAWGLLVGLGTGCLTMAYGAHVARLWFPHSVGTVSGVFTAAAVVGQFALLPLWTVALTRYGWQAPIVGCSALTVVAIIVNWMWMREPEDRQSEVTDKLPSLFLSIGDVIVDLLTFMRRRPFWILVLLFLICGATTNGIMWSHFTPAAVDCGINVEFASLVLALVGIFNVAGTMAAGWLADRISSRVILMVVFFGRSLTLLWLPLIFFGAFETQLVTFGILFGMLDVATVPPVIVLCNRVFGRNGAIVFGWINAFHQLGAGGMAFVGAHIRTEYGSYDLLWYASGIIAMVAAFLVFLDRYDSDDNSRAHAS